MSSDVLIDLGDVSSPRSNTSDDADAVNTESARIYFGPLQSPEKKFASTTKLKTPLRRSQRFSTRLRESMHAERQIRQPTPTRLNLAERGSSSGEEDMLKDEPSLVLASKVLQAHDNPSPPPSPPPDGERTPPNPNILIDLTDPMPDLTSGASSPPQTLDGGETNTSQPDLINFDSFSTPSATPRTDTLLLNTSIQTESPLFRRSTATTVDDLLSLSPLSELPSSVSAQETTLTTSNSVTPTTEEENQVLLTLIGDTLAIDAPAPPAEEVLVQLHTPDVSAAQVPAMVPEVTIPSPVSQPQTPVRRSPRKRSSISPARPRPITDTTTLLNVPTPGRPGPSTLAHPTSSPVFPPLGVRVKKKSRSRDVSPNTEGSSVNPQDIALLPDEKRPVSPGREAKRKLEAEQPRRLGSLSPTSTGLLMQLLHNGSNPSTGEQATAAETVATIIVDQPKQLASTNVEPHSPSRTIAPQPTEGEAEMHSAVAPSATSTDPPRTPARRIPIHEAIAQGTFSPSKQSTSSFAAGTAKSGPNVGLLGTSVFRRPRQALDDPSRSPAKRVPISQAFAPWTVPSPEKGKAAVRSASPTRPVLKERARSNSVESVSQPPLFERGRSADPARPPRMANSFVKPPSASSTPTGNTNTPLPHPLVPSSSRAHPPIPEVDEGEAENHSMQQQRLRSRSPLASSPAKHVSTLRQPSSNVTSRIPRIGAKPYARPKPKEPSPTPAPEPRPPIVPRRALGAAGGATRPFRALQAGQGSGSSSESSPYLGPPCSATNQTSHATTQQSTAADGSRVSTLKRKREGEKSLASPPGAKPFIGMRKVVPSMLGQSSRTGTSTTPPSGTPAVESTPHASPPKSKGPIRMRKVADWKPPPREPSSMKVDNPPPGVGEPVVSLPSAPGQTTSQPSPSPPSVPPSTEPSSSTIPSVEQPPIVDAAQATLSQPPPGTEPELHSETNGTRRSSRSRRAGANQATDVFGVVDPPPVRPLNVRRKRPPPPDTSAFAGMSAMALRALTSSNTQKNQQQVAALKTEVIRKEGKRPGSPTTKVRTVMEKQREIKAQQRQQRAERRARRSSEGAQASESQVDMSVDLGDVSNITVDDDGVPVRHRRGPGDEEDYETPPRPERPFKRERLEHEAETKGDKTVKWDRGLATAVYLDEISPKLKKPASSDATRKGCLAPTAKTLRLDTLGNVLDANTPLPNLVREDVIVKKFVYEDDEDAQSEAPEIAPTPPLEIKPKGKSKKSKS
ncbi:hypothetical protein DAEQUDRAFT_765762 [Daedalea quercina L-15889]|uniref:Uncharacterized protein n=1 Tax=Daedalea quercina L-15889 TaxID=1314783 RepID=A0A165Q3R4_9APHY|nr:hypothetical protein DAEQUDRAFT_765762 [Daedalea quercina L-15889]